MPYVGATILGLVVIFLIGSAVYDAGSYHVKAQYQECISNGAPQANCIKSYLEIK